MIETCVMCGKEFNARTCAKYCPVCRATANAVRMRRYYRIHREQILTKQKAQRTKRKLLKPVKTCARCGCEIDRYGRTNFCPDCRVANYREYQKRYRVARREEQTIVKPKVAVKPVEKNVVKTKKDPNKNRLAYLRRRLEQAQTPEIRSRYFRQYVLLKQEFLRGAVT